LMTILSQLQASRCHEIGELSAKNKQDCRESYTDAYKTMTNQ